MKKICYIVTLPAVVNSFLRAHIQAAAEVFEVSVICSPVDEYLLEGLSARIFYLPIERKPSPLRDIISFWKIYRLLRCEKFDIVHSIMPKTGFMAMLTSWIVRVPCRIHTFTGQVWVTQHGVRRVLLKLVDKLIGAFATEVLADSASQRDFLIDQGLLPQSKVTVIGAGSICGVDPLRFQPDRAEKQNVRNELRIAQDAKIILFVGRLNIDKGMLDLAAAFFILANKYPNLVLLLVGAEENVSFKKMQDICDVEPERFHYVPFNSKPERYMAASDIYCQPSYREGFGMTLIEAAACGVPAVASRICGIVDAVEDGRTGLLFEAGSVAGLVSALSKIIDNDIFLSFLGRAARLRALELFSANKITEGMMLIYQNNFINRSEN